MPGGAVRAPPRLDGEWSRARTGEATGRRRRSAARGVPPASGRASARCCIAALAGGGRPLGAGELLRTAGVGVVGELVQHREQPHPNTYLGPGKVAEAKAAAQACDANLIACDDELTARQERNLEAGARPAGRRPHDGDPRHLRLARGQRRGQAPGRAGAARVQPRAHARPVDATSSGSAAASARGDRARRRSRPTAASRATGSRRLRRRLEHVKGTRAVQRAERERAALPTVALVGYTNAGKSTLLNALTGAEVGVRDRLFHTLDPTTRTLQLGGPALPAHRHRRLHQQAAPPARRRVRRRRSRRRAGPSCCCTSSMPRRPRRGGDDA